MGHLNLKDRMGQIFGDLRNAKCLQYSTESNKHEKVGVVHVYIHI